MRENNLGYRQTESSEIPNSQIALRFSTPQFDARFLNPQSLKLLRRFAAIHPMMSLNRVEKPKPEILETEGRSFFPIFVGVCGSDKKIVTAQMEPDEILNLPNVPPANFGRVGQFTHKLLKGPRVLRPFTLGHEIVAINSQGIIGVIYPIFSCQFKFDDEAEFCEACIHGRQNECANLQDGPVRGLSLGTGATTQSGKDLGGGFSEQLVAYEDQFIPLPIGLPPKVAILTDAYACAVNGIEGVKDRLDETSDTLIIGLGAIGYSTMNRLKLMDMPSEKITVLVKHEYQKKIVENYGCIPVTQRDTNNLRGSYDVVYDCVGSKQSVVNGRLLTGENGHLVELGMNPLFGPDKRISYPFWATLAQYTTAINDLTELSKRHNVSDLVNAEHTLHMPNKAFFPTNSTVIKNAITINAIRS